MSFEVSSIFHILLFMVLFSTCWGQDEEVMGMLKNTINAPSSLQWTDQNVCKWKHVECDPGNRVISILIGYQRLEGSLPKELERLTNLERFECQSNSLTGPFPYLSKSLKRLIIRDNQFSNIPDDFFKGMIHLEEVRLDHNPFPPWQIPTSLMDCTALRIFSGQSAGFVGTIPTFFGKDGPFPGLVFLSLSSNSLEGALPTSLSGSSIQNLLVNGQNSNSKLNGTLAVLQNMTYLKQIWVNDNSFTGPIPDLSNSVQLFDVNFRDNQLTGVVPPSLTSLPSLQVVNLTNNKLQGSPPLFKDGVSVDNITGKGRNQFCTNMVGQPCSPLVNALLSVVEPFGYPLNFAISWEGNDPCRAGSEWTGVICSGDGNISGVNFQNMGLSGTISPTFASLTSLTKLILANNDLTSTIPSELTSMPLLQELDVSNNHIYGHVPPFRKDVVLKLGGNPDIGNDHPTPTSSSSSKHNDNKHNIVAVILGISAMIAILLGIGVIVCLKLRRKSKRTKKIVSDAQKIGVAANANIGSEGPTPTPLHQGEAGNMMISIQILRQVTSNFSEENILGRGGFGIVYRGELHDGTKIGVKRMQLGRMVGEKGLNEFMAEIAVLTNVRHRNLVALLGYCLEESERILVYEYMPQGALSKHLFNWKEQGLKPLDWKTRLTIALDVARGVEYLHSLAKQIFIHRDLKPSNILLGDDMRAKVSDFGLVRLAPEGKASFQTGLAGTFGYLAPEYAVTGRLTTKVDVYSFGVILMEMITGRKALDESQEEENIHLVMWFRRVLPNKDTFRPMIDPTIDIVDEETLSNIGTVAELAGHCTSSEHYRRPDMSHVVSVLSPLVEVWKPTEPNIDDVYGSGINLDMTLPEALQRWQAYEEGVSTMDLTSSPTSTHYNDQR